MRFDQTTWTVQLGAAGGGADEARVWARSTLQPIQKISVIISSNGVVTSAGNLNWDVLYGGNWTGKPFDNLSTHSGGVSQANGVLTAGEYAHVVYNEEDLLPSNYFQAPNNMSQYGIPIVLDLENDKALPVTLYVTFVLGLLGDR